MRFDIITIFPKIFDSYFQESIIKRAQRKRIVKIKVWNLRDFSKDKHKKVDDKPYGGGAGMVIQAEPILRAETALKIKNQKSKIVFFSAKGKQFNQKMAYDWAKKYDRIFFITGRYEGIDERAAQILKKTYKGDFEELSIGPYVLTDGDVATMVVVSALARLVPGVIRTESLAEESHLGLLLKSEPKLSTINYKLQTNLEYPHYTRPEVLVWPPRRYGKTSKTYAVPKILLSGHHQKISSWRKSKMK